MVTAVGAVNLIVGTLILIGAIGIFVGGTAFSSIFVGKLQEEVKKAPPPPNATPQQLKEFEEAQKFVGTAGTGFFAAVFGVVGFCFAILGVPQLLGGIGVLQRKQWGRVLTLVFAFFWAIVGGLFALLSLLGMSVTGILMWGAICAIGIWSIVVLFNSQNAAEFRAPQTT
jgi:hypothetical protein